MSTGQEKRVLVTGGGSGLGAAIVRALAGAGYAVDFTYRASGEAASALASELNEAHPGLGIRAYALDLADRAALDAFCETAEEIGYHGFVHNAGQSSDGLAAMFDQDKAEAAMQAGLGHAFGTIVRSAAHLQGLVDADPFSKFALPAGAKRVITFLREAPRQDLDFPLSRDDASILARIGLEVFSAYVPGTKGPVFMQLIERTYGRDVTTRTVDTVRKCAAA